MRMAAWNRLSRFIHTEWLGIVVFLLALGLRLYRLGGQPLWLDEIYSVQLVRQGFLAILQNSQNEPHPPLFYLLQWLTTAGGAAQAEWGWRWVSALSGGLTILCLYLLCRGFTGRLMSTLAALALAVSPMHVYYSQEGRPFAFVTLLGAWSMLLVSGTISQPKCRWRWVTLALVSLAGLYCNYFYLLVILAQGLYLLLRTRQRDWWLYAALVGLGSIPAAFWMAPTLLAASQHSQTLPPLTFLAFFQSLGGETARFPLAWYHGCLALVVGGLSFLGIALAVGRSFKEPLGHYLVFQALIPLVLLFGILAPLGVKMPYYQVRQLLLLAPALFGLLAYALEHLTRRAGWWLAVLLTAAALVASAAGLRAYWSYIKSPETLTVLSMRSEIQAGDSMVSLDYYTTAAAYYYLPETPIWVALGTPAGEVQFTPDRLLYPLTLLDPPAPADITLAEIRAASRMWVLGRRGVREELRTALTEQCTLLQEFSHPPFAASLWTNCAPQENDE